MNVWRKCPADVLQAALVKFSSFDIKEGGKLNTYSQFETVDTAAGQHLNACMLATLVFTQLEDPQVRVTSPSYEDDMRFHHEHSSG